MSALDNIIQDINKKYKEVIVTKGIPKVNVNKLPFSSARLNYSTYGGIPRGRIIEFAGEENAGKTTVALDVCSNAQKLFITEYEEELNQLNSIDKLTKTQQSRLEYLKTRGIQRVAYIDCENTLDDEWALKLTVDTLSLLVLKPIAQTAEQIFQIVLDIIETDEIGLVIIDSLGVMLSSSAYTEDMEKKTYCGIAGALTLFSKKAELLCSKTKCTLIGINQMRDDINSSYGGKTTTGGRAWKHNCTLRIEFNKGDFIDEKGNSVNRRTENPTGNLINYNIVKTKAFKPDRRVGSLTLNYTEGIDYITDLIDIAIRYEIIQQAGAWFSIIDDTTNEVIIDTNNDILKFQGKNNLKNYLIANEMISIYIQEKVNNLIKI